MKKRFTVAIVCLFLAGVLVIGCGGQTDPAKIIPEDAQAVVLIPNIGQTAGHISEFMDYIGKQVPAAAGGKQMMKVFTGADLTNPDELAAKGINPKGGLAFALLDMTKMDGAFIVAVKKEADFIAFLNELAKKSGAPELTKDGDAYSSPGVPGQLKIKKGFAIFAQNPDTLNKLTGKGKTLSGSDDFKTALAEIDAGGDLVVYISAKMLAAAPTPQAQQMAKALKDLKAIGASLNIGAEEWSLKVFTSMAGMEDAKKLLSSGGEGSLLESLPGPAPVLARTNLSIPALWNYIKEKSNSDPEFKKNYEMAMAQLTIPATVNLETDLIGNIVGDLALAYYGQSGKGRRKTPDFVLTIVVKDEAKVKDSLQKIADSMLTRKKKKKSDLEEMGVIEFGPGRDKIYIAVVKSNLVITPVADRMKKVLATFAGAAAQPATASIHAEAKKLLLNKNATAAYVGAKHLLEAMKENASRNKKAQLEAYEAQMAELLKSYMIISAELMDEGSLLTLNVHLGE